MAKKNKQGNMKFMAKHGVVTGLTPEDVALLTQKVNSEIVDEGAVRTLWVQNTPIRGTIDDIAAVILKLLGKAKPDPKSYDGWEIMLFRRDKKTGKIYVKMPDRSKPHFTWFPNMVLPRQLKGMFALLMKLLGLTQEEIDVVFPDDGEPVEVVESSAGDEPIEEVDTTESGDPSDEVDNPGDEAVAEDSDPEPVAVAEQPLVGDKVPVPVPGDVSEDGNKAKGKK